MSFPGNVFKIVQIRKIYLFLAIISATALYISLVVIEKRLHQTPDILAAKDTSGFHVITNYPVMVETPWKENMTDTNITRLWQRQEELEETLQRNLDHPLVTTVHLLINQESARKRLTELQLRNKYKIRVVRINSLPKHRHFFAYINEKLQNRIVSIMNMDIYIGEGFEQLNKTFILSENVCYALTRNGRQERRCSMAGRRRYCGNGYQGSHDVYIFVLTQSVTVPVLSELDIPMHVFGVDNVLLWIIKNRLGKKLLNPCKLLKTYHNHCVDIHGSARTRINIHGKSLKTAPSGLYG